MCVVAWQWLAWMNSRFLKRPWLRKSARPCKSGSALTRPQSSSYVARCARHGSARCDIKGWWEGVRGNFWVEVEWILLSNEQCMGWSWMKMSFLNKNIGGSVQMYFAENKYTCMLLNFSTNVQPYPIRYENKFLTREKGRSLFHLEGQCIFHKVSYRGIFLLKLFFPDNNQTFLLQHQIVTISTKLEYTWNLLLWNFWKTGNKRRCKMYKKKNSSSPVKQYNRLGSLI